MAKKSPAKQSNSPPVSEAVPIVEDRSRWFDDVWNDCPPDGWKREAMFALILAHNLKEMFGHASTKMAENASPQQRFVHDHKAMLKIEPHVRKFNRDMNELIGLKSPKPNAPIVKIGDWRGISYPDLALQIGYKLASSVQVSAMAAGIRGPEQLEGKLFNPIHPEHPSTLAGIRHWAETANLKGDLEELFTRMNNSQPPKAITRNSKKRNSTRNKLILGYAEKGNDIKKITKMMNTNHGADMSYDAVQKVILRARPTDKNEDK